MRETTGPLLSRVLFALLVGAVSVAGADSLEERTVGGVDVELARIEGTVLDVEADAGGGLLLLVRRDAEAPVRAASATGRDEPDEAPGNLVRWRDGVLESIVDGLPRAHSLHPDGDRRATGRVLVAAGVESARGLESELSRFDDGKLRPLPGLWIDTPGHERHGLLAHPARLDAGRLAVLDDDHSTVREIALPIDARRRGDALELTTPPVTRLPSPDGATPELWIVGPRIVGGRLVLWSVDPETGTSEEIWCRLPAPESVEHSHLVRLRGEPALVAFTTDAEKVGVFAKLDLRVWWLVPDRTRRGALPALRAETATRRWFVPGVRAEDFDGDGREDLIVLQPRGMGGGELRAEVWPAGAGVRFEEPLHTDLDRRTVGQELGDVLGDPTPDLVTVGDGLLEVRAGLARHRKRAFEPRPDLALALGDLPRASEDPEMDDDLDLHVLPGRGDAGAEVVLVRTLATPAAAEDAPEDSETGPHPRRSVVIRIASKP